MCICFISLQQLLRDGIPTFSKLSFILCLLQLLSYVSYSFYPVSLIAFILCLLQLLSYVSYSFYPVSLIAFILCFFLCVLQLLSYVFYSFYPMLLLYVSYSFYPKSLIAFILCFYPKSLIGLLSLIALLLCCDTPYTSEAFVVKTSMLLKIMFLFHQTMAPYFLYNILISMRFGAQAYSASLRKESKQNTEHKSRLGN